MSAYFQMGHDTQNLVGAKDLDEFAGIILSPVNREPDALLTDIVKFRKKGKFDIALDPQLYIPKTQRGSLPSQPYFPNDFDTGIYSTPSSWNPILKNMFKFAQRIKVDAIASPVVLPRMWTEDYFSLCSKVSSLFVNIKKESKIKILTTVIVGMNYLSTEDNVMAVASIMSRPESDGYYVVFVSEVEPRREISDPEQLLGAMKLVKELKNTGKTVIVSYCSTDMVLYKAAGADHCATGKFFNLRRFTKNRYEEPSNGGGGQLAYWFEHSLIAFLRDNDLPRLRKEGYSQLLGTGYSKNYWSSQIEEHIRTNPKKAWVKLGWRQYLSWFGKQERAMCKSDAIEILEDWLRSAEDLWINLNDEGVLLDEPKNNGYWIRPWRQALRDFKRKYSL